MSQLRRLYTSIQVRTNAAVHVHECLCYASPVLHHVHGGCTQLAHAVCAGVRVMDMGMHDGCAVAATGKSVAAAIAE